MTQKRKRKKEGRKERMICSTRPAEMTCRGAQTFLLAFISKCRLCKWFRVSNWLGFMPGSNDNNNRAHRRASSTAHIWILHNVSFTLTTGIIPSCRIPKTESKHFEGRVFLMLRWLGGGGKLTRRWDGWLGVSVRLGKESNTSCRRCYWKAQKCYAHKGEWLDIRYRRDLKRQALAPS